MSRNLVVPVGRIEPRILWIRGKRMIVDADLADLYGVSTRRLNEQVRRNAERFPDDFVFQLTEQENAEVVANCDRLENLKYSTVLPFVFTEHGALMAANVLKSAQAITISLHVVRTFVKLRELTSSNKEIAMKLNEIEQRIDRHDQHIAALIEAIRELMAPPPEKRKKPIGYHTEREG